MQRQPTHSWLPQPQHATDAVRLCPPGTPLCYTPAPFMDPLSRQITISISMSMSVAVRLSLAATQKVIYLNMVINLVE